MAAPLAGVLRSCGAGIVACALAVACTRSLEHRPVRTPGPLPSGQPGPGAPEVPWSRKTRDERMEFMGLVVFPKMKELFRARDGEGRRDFRCQTCHGEDMEAVRFAMPNSLYALPEGDPVGAARAYDEKTTEFMQGTVLPAMKALLADDSTAERVTCFTCHPKG
jgi:hypothetical protein